MMVISCGSCRKRRLMSISSITSIRNENGAINVLYTCDCGANGILHTGRAGH